MAVANFSDKTDLPLRVGREKHKSQMNIAIMRVFEILLTFGHSWPGLNTPVCMHGVFVFERTATAACVMRACVRA